MSTPKPKNGIATKPEVHHLVAAFIIPKEEGERMIEILGELPSKYFQDIVGPMLQSFHKTFRADITITIDPNKMVPIPKEGASRTTHKTIPKDEK